MLPILQIVTKNDLIKRKASIYLEEMFNKYGIDSRTIVYADLSPLFKDATSFIVKKFELDKKLSKEDLGQFKHLCGVKALKPTPVAPPVVKPEPPVYKDPPSPPPRPTVKPKAPVTHKPKGTGKSK